MSLTTAEIAILSVKAMGAKDAAYCPYSNFRVGASVLTEDGTFITGSNVENASYPVGICAEKCAFGTAVASGHRSFKAVAVATDVVPGSSPCGSCRQFMREFLEPSVPIYIYGGDGKYFVKTMEELLPESFGREDIHKNQ